MNIQQAKKEITDTLHAYLAKDASGRYLYPPVRQRPLLLIGPPGIGKTAIVEQAARENHVNFVSYSMTHHTRQSALGLPVIVKEQHHGETFQATEYTMSEILLAVYREQARTGRPEGILFLDEINCVSETLAPIMLEFLENKTFGGRKMPEGWLIVTAGNPPEYNKSVRDFDIATLDRVRVITVEADCQSFLSYGIKRNLHGAILSYLSLHPERFYLAKRKADALAFVTARGWEDLSWLLQSYEKLAVPVTPELIAEFLHDEKTAQDFSSYYKLYQKYGTDYAIPGILSGTLSPDAYREKCRIAGSGTEEEQMTVVQLTAGELSRICRLWMTDEQKLIRLHEILKSSLSSGASPDSLIPELQKAYDTKKQLGLAAPDALQAEEQALDRLQEISAEIREKSPAPWQETVHIAFDTDLKKRKQLLEKTRRALSHAFTFITDSFGEDAELRSFLSTLSESEPVMSFIARNGCPEYIEYSRRFPVS